MLAHVETPTTDPKTAREAGAPGRYDITWRYLGDRDEADQAYCFRFDVSQAPEPVGIPGGAWVYALPAV